MLTLTYWVSKADAPSVAVGADEQVPCETLLGHRAGQVEPDVVVEIGDRFSEHFLAAASDIRVGVLCVGPQRIQGSAEVGHRTRTIVLWPLLGPQRLRHRRPGVEGSDVATGRDAGPGPSQRRLVRPQPQLKRLGGDRAQMRRHVPPLRAVSDEFTCDQFDHSQRCGQHDVIEVDALAQHPGLDVRTLAEMRLQRRRPGRARPAVRPVGGPGRRVGRRS